MLVLITEGHRGIQVLGCDDCPFCSEDPVYGSRYCEITSEKNTEIAREQPGKAVPAWCPLRGGAVSVSAEPYVLERDSAGNLLLNKEREPDDTT